MKKGVGGQVELTIYILTNTTFYLQPWPVPWIPDGSQGSVLISVHTSENAHLTHPNLALVLSLPNYCSFSFPHSCMLSHFSWLSATLWTINLPGSCPWDSPGKNTGVGCHALLQGIFPDPGIKTASLMSPALAGRFFTISTTWEISFPHLNK